MANTGTRSGRPSIRSRMGDINSDTASGPTTSAMLGSASASRVLASRAGPTVRPCARVLAAWSLWLGSVTAMRRHLTYANVTATIALFVALGGGAYAVTNVGSGDIKDNSIRSLDLRDRHGVKGVDVPRNGLGGREIDERSLNASRIVQISGDHSQLCDPSGVYAECVETTLRLRESARVLAIATGGQETAGGPGGGATATCQVRFDGQTSSSFSPGESLSDNTDVGATNGFARTEISGVLARGRHTVSLA